MSAPVNTTAPAVTGTPTSGSTLSTTDGTWTGSPTFTYQWFADDLGGGNYKPLAGATGNTYLIADAALGRHVLVAVTGTNGSGAITALSNAVLVAAGSGGSGSSGVATVVAADASIVVGGSGANPTLQTATLDQIATLHPPAAAVPMSGKKHTGLGAGTGSGDSLRYEQLFAAGAVPIADIVDPTTGKVIGSIAGAAAAVFPPGYQIGYDQNAGITNIASTTEATGTTVIAGSSYIFDGAAVMAHFFAPYVLGPNVVGGQLSICLFEGATQIGRLTTLYVGGSATAQNAVPVSCFYKFTPSAAAHTYSVTAFASSTTGTPTINGGAGGTGVLLPVFLRFTKV